MPDPVTIALTAAKYAPLAKKGWDWITGKKKKKVPGYKPSAMENRYTNFLQSQAKSGMGNENMNLMMNASGRSINQSVNQMASGIENRGVMQGLENSAVMSQQLAGADAFGGGQLAQTARNIAMKNFELKQTAQDKLGSIGIDRSNMDLMRRQSQFDIDRADSSSDMDMISKVAGDFLTKRKNKDLRTELEEDGWDLKDLPPELAIKILGL
tara:strand:- start:281 stop:913 length:633 start_codon:yes stop_codon:yes gene_type:complete